MLSIFFSITFPTFVPILSNTQRRSTSKRSTQAMSNYNRIQVKDLLNHPAASSGGPKGGSSSKCEVCLCDLDGCTREFASRKALEIHQKRVHSAPTVFACKICPSTFSTSPNLAKHVRAYSHIFNTKHLPVRVLIIETYIYIFMKLLSNKVQYSLLPFESGSERASKT